MPLPLTRATLFKTDGGGTAVGCRPSAYGHFCSWIRSLLRSTALASAVGTTGRSGLPLGAALFGLRSCSTPLGLPPTQCRPHGADVPSHTQLRSLSKHSATVPPALCYGGDTTFSPRPHFSFISSLPLGRSLKRPRLLAPVPFTHSATVPLSALCYGASLAVLR